MELKLNINTKNTYPKGGIFIKNAAAEVWLHEIQSMGLALDDVNVFPVPGMRANELSGCLIVFNQSTSKIGDIGKNNFYQLAANKLFIPENTFVSPELTEEEWYKLFSEKYHFLHPETGLVELEDEINWTDLIQFPKSKEIVITEPSKTVSIPQFITSMRIEVDQEKILEGIENPVSEEEMIEKLPFNMKKLLNGNNREMDKFLAYLEKNPEVAMKLGVPLDTLGTGRGGNAGSFSFNAGIGSLFNFAWIRRFLDNLSSGENSSTGFFRYGFVLLFVVLARSCKGSELKSNLPPILVFIGIVIFVIFMISLWAGSQSGSSGSAGGGSFLIDSNRFAALQNKYEKLAEQYAANKEYQKAAHIYLKLLKNHHKAAEVLEKGELYPEAATIYLKYHKNKQKAAVCYEKGHAYKEAIELYKELNEDEKVGDLYAILNNKSEADKYFEKVILNYKMNFQYVKASLIYKNKTGNISEAQELLLQGWRTNKDAGKCLNNYFANISVKELPAAITGIYESELNDSNKEKFLELLKHEYDKDKTLEDLTRGIAYEIVAEKVDKKPEIASQLIGFNRSNESFIKDVMKFKLKKRNNS
ncbi:MAG: hypothetical protein ABI793_08130 [Flavobacterium sp.]